MPLPRARPQTTACLQYAESRAVGLQIADTNGNLADPGQPLTVGKLQPSDVNIEYTLCLVNHRQTLLASPYAGIIRSKLGY
ncbi:hypothetical protein [Serratia symbiotica]|uniref:Uncharacterized protein n=1 Tax=Serratia symbiotica TaxID=138074 RepID=A0A7D5NNV9_9GAMM|nr:hypothetical protein [Serratia symbiotica]QLH64568.1 hypothetical protein SYMBAF_17305 [Serratia symbiotica]